MIEFPPELGREGYVLRAACPEDRPFELSLFATTRLDAALLAQWPPAEREAFLSSQFALQDIHYHRYYENAAFLIAAQRSEPIGRMIVDKGPIGWCLVDIGFLPERRGRGLGTALLSALQRAATAAKAENLSLHVELGNPARRLYARLGFAETGDIGTHIAMTWRIAVS